MDKNKKLFVSAFVLLAAGLIIFLVLFLREKKAGNEMAQLFELEKEEMSNDYLSYAQQYDELQEIITNDSLRVLLDSEKMRVQRLLEELQAVKRSDAAEIMRLKKELKTVREVMRNYVMQIDSLGRLNKQLGDENKKLKRRNEEVVSQVSTLKEEKEVLTEKVTIASKLNASNIVVEKNNKRGKTARRIKDLTQLVFHFNIDRNPSAESGVKTVYLRIMKPDNSVLTKSSGNTFAFENTRLTYSIKREIEYGGDAVPVTMYWNVEEFLFEGKYQVDIFIDGNVVGTSYFEL